MGLPRTPQQFKCTRTSKAMLRYLPYSGREPYPTRGYQQGRYEECFASVAIAKTRLRKLKREDRIEEAEIVVPAGTGNMTRTVHEWRHRRERRR